MQRTRRHYQRPPAASIAASNARLLSVRLPPALRGTSGLPSAARRSASSRANDSCDMRRPGQSDGSAVDVVDAIFACALVSNASIEIGSIDVRVKGQKGSRLIDPIACGSRRILTHAIRNQVLDTQNRE